MARIRNTKKLGQRVDRTYLRRLDTIPRWRRILTLLFVIAGLAWLGLYAAARNQTPYTAGALTASHAVPGGRCSVCHGAARVGQKIADARCLACHDGPVHQASQKFTPACISCHVEHQGAMRLAGAGDGWGDDRCAKCHVDRPDFESHPEFAAVKEGKNQSALRFSHQKHVGELSQKCGDCHLPAGVGPSLAKAAPHSHVSSRALMSIPTYAATCLPCHPLTFDDKIADAAPHDNPEVIHGFVVDQLTKYIAAHPAELGKEGTPGGALAWVQYKVAADEKKLTEEVCARCHALPAGQTVAVVPTHVASRWFTKANFDHSSHQSLTCATCHPKAADSKFSDEMQIPGIAVCRQCHAAGNSSAGANCATCHTYHDWSKEKAIDGKYVL